MNNLKDLAKKFDKNIGEKVEVKKGTTEITSNDGKTYHIHKSGIDDNGKDVFTASQKDEWITPTILKQANGNVTSFDPMEEHREMYNQNNFRVVFENTHYYMPRRVATIQTVICEPFKHCYLPHGYYTVWAEFIGNKAPIEIKLLTITGDKMFKGMTKASRPEEKKNFY